MPEITERESQYLLSASAYCGGRVEIRCFISPQTGGLLIKWWVKEDGDWQQIAPIDLFESPFGVIPKSGFARLAKFLTDHQNEEKAQAQEVLPSNDI